MCERVYGGDTGLLCCVVSSRYLRTGGSIITARTVSRTHSSNCLKYHAATAPAFMRGISRRCAYSNRAAAILEGGREGEGKG